MPEGYKGRTLSVSDVVEIICSGEKSIFYFCDSFDFKRIEFQKEKVMTRVDHPNYDCVHKKKENVSVFFIGQDGLKQIKCKEFELLRCKYSKT